MPNHYPAAAEVHRAAARPAARGARRAAPSSSTRSSATIPASTTSSGGSCRSHHFIGDRRRSSSCRLRAARPARDRGRASAATAPSSRPTSRSFCTSRIERGRDRRRQDQCLHPRHRAGRLRQRVRRDRAARGDQLQPPASRRSLARGYRPLHRPRRSARPGRRDVLVTRIVVTGYASMDYVDAARRRAGGRSHHAHPRAAGRAWPRLGGSPAYVAAALVAGGDRRCAAAELGRRRTRPVPRIAGGLAALGVRGEGVATSSGGRTPLSILAYQPDGGCLCLYDAGPAGAAGTDAGPGGAARGRRLGLPDGRPARRQPMPCWRASATATRLVWAVKARSRAPSRPARGAGPGAARPT